MDYVHVHVLPVLHLIVPYGLQGKPKVFSLLDHSLLSAIAVVAILRVGLDLKFYAAINSTQLIGRESCCHFPPAGSSGADEELVYYFLAWLYGIAKEG